MTLVGERHFDGGIMPSKAKSKRGGGQRIARAP
jgi:hypothetical protein